MPELTPDRLLSPLIKVETAVRGALQTPLRQLNLPELPEIPGPAEMASTAVRGLPGGRFTIPTPADLLGGKFTLPGLPGIAQLLPGLGVGNRGKIKEEEEKPAPTGRVGARGRL